MKKILCSLLIVLSLGCLVLVNPKKSNAYSEYISDVSVESVLYDYNYIFKTGFTIESGSSNLFANLELHYGYELNDEDIPELYIFRYIFEIFGNVKIDNLVQWYIPINEFVIDNIGNEVSDVRMNEEIYELLDRSTLKMNLYLKVDGNTITPYMAIVDYDYITDIEFELQSFDRNEPMYSGVLCTGLEMEMVHTDLLYQTYLYNAYRIDGNTLSKLGNISIVDWLEDSVGGFFDTQLFGDFTIGDIVLLSLSMGLLFLFLRFFVGG